MKNQTKTKIHKLIIAFLLVIIFMLLFLLSEEFTETNIIYQDKIEYIPKVDTIIETNTIREIEKDPFLIRDTIIDTFTQVIIDQISKEELARIAQNHYKINVYVDSVLIDTIGQVIITDSIQRNHILHRSFAYDLRLSQKSPAKSFISVGGGLGVTNNQLDFGIGADFTTKKGVTFGYDYQALSKSHMITVKKSIFNFK